MKPCKGVVAEDVRQLVPPDYKGFNVLQDAHIVDLRSWNPTGDGKSDGTRKLGEITARLREVWGTYVERPVF